MLHPQVLKQLGLKHTAAVFEIKREALETRDVPVYEGISKFPAVRRDFAFVVSKDVNASDLCAHIRDIGGKIVRQVVIFDVFEDASLGDKRSIALGVIAQDPERTLEDEAIDALAEKIVSECASKFGATLRS